MSTFDLLTEGIVNRDLSKEGQALMNKWGKTGLLEGLDSDHKKSTMARLLENQAKELLREASSMAGGDVQGQPTQGSSKETTPNNKKLGEEEELMYDKDGNISEKYVNGNYVEQ